MKKFIFSAESPQGNMLSVLSLFLRLMIGVAMLTHGLPTLMSFVALSGTFPDPLGLSSPFSLLLVIGAEVGCSLLIMSGLGTRIAALPLVFAMFIAFFVVHSSDPFAAKELAFFYLISYISIFMLGSGKYSCDHYLLKDRLFPQDQSKDNSELVG